MGPRSGHPRRRRPTSVAVGVLAAAALAAGFVVLQPSRVTGAVGDVGLEGPSYRGAGSEPPGSKPESKLWWHDGSWWGVLWAAASRAHHIFRLETSSQNWIDTGVAVDGRPNTRADVLWDGRKLYVASHVYAARAARGPPARLFRFSYDAARKRYSRDRGFPVAINDRRTETLVIDKDSTGRLWATWVQDASVYVAHTVAGDRTWARPFVLPATGADGVTDDDIASVVAFGGSKVGVMWSNRHAGSFSFAVHLDGQPAWSWRPVEVALGGRLNADDHINLKADRDGRVFAAVRTRHRLSTVAQVVLLVRSAAGTWGRHTFGTVAEKHGRAIVLVDEENSRVHVFATSRENNGTIYTKSSPLESPSFAPGLGTAFLRSAESATMNNATSTKQTVNGMTDAVVVGGLAATSSYWHNMRPLPGGTRASPQAELVGSPTSGFAPLTVRFSDRSPGGVAGRTWDFGDGSAGSTEASPVHTYERPGSYSVTLTVADGRGAESARRRVGYVTVLPLVARFSASSTSGRVPLRVRFTDASSGPVASRLWDFGDGTTSTEANPAKAYRAPGLYSVRLTVTDTAGNSASSTRKAYVNALPLAAAFTGAPRAGPAPRAVHFADRTLGVPTAWAWHFGDGATSTERSPTHVYKAPGSYTVSLTVRDAAGNTSTRTRRAYVTVAPLTADFVAEPTVGPAPLAVAFHDTSRGRPAGWSWDFGDGTTSSRRNPTHVYRNPGAYTVSLTVRAADGRSSARSKTSFVTATSDLVVRPAAEAEVRSTLGRRAYLAFDVPTLPGTLVSAKLRLFVTREGRGEAEVYAVGGAAAPLATLDPAARTWVEAALPIGAFRAGRRAALVIEGDARFAGRGAGINQPQLVLTVDYGPRNAPPNALADVASLDEDARALVDVVANDHAGPSEEAHQSLTLTAITSAPRHGTAAIVDGKILYRPRADYNGPDTLVYSVCDDAVDVRCAAASLRLSVLPVNDAPSAAGDVVAATEDIPRVLGLLANDVAGPANEADQTLTVEALTALPEHGRAEIVAGQLVYTPARDDNGGDALAYRVCDDGAPRLCTEAAVSISLVSVNDAPRTAPDTAATDEDLTALVAVLANDRGGPTDEAAQALRIDTIVDAPSTGTASIEGDAVRYVPALDFHGRDSFTYRVCDDGDPSLCTTETAIVDVLSVNDLPSARDDRAVVEEDSFVSIEVLANDGPGEPEQTMELEYLVTPPAQGTAEVVLGRILYRPEPDFAGVDRLTYKACDDGRPRFCFEAQVSVTVIAVNDSPRADPDTAVVPEDGGVNIQVLADDDAGPQNEAAQGLVIDGIAVRPQHGSVSVGRGWVRYTPEADYGGPDVFSYRLCDVGDPPLCELGVVDVEVVTRNDAPEARADAATATEDGVISVDVLANDGPGAGEQRQTVRLAEIAWAPAHGRAVVERGRIVYRPFADYHGTDSLVYRVCDSGAPEQCSAATLALQVRPWSDPPRLRSKLARLQSVPHTGAIRFRRGRFSGRAASRGPRSAS